MDVFRLLGHQPVQGLGSYVGAVRPNDRSQLLVELNSAEVGRVSEGCKYTPMTIA